MRTLIRSAVLALGLLPGLACAQSSSFPQTAPPNTVLGRLSVSAGPVQAIPFLAFVNNLPLASGKIWIGNVGNFATPQTPSGDCTFSISGVVTCTQSAGNFTVTGNLSVGGTSAFTGGVTLGSPTGGNKGVGTINIAGDFYKNGAIIPESVVAPLTITAFGVVGCPSCVLISGTGHGDSAYNIASTDRYVYTNAAFTAARTWTLPAANSLAIGTTIWVQDAQGTVGTTNTLTIQRAGADSIDISNTSLVITGAGGGITFTTDGVSNWGTPIQTVSTGGTGQKTLTNHGLLVGAGINPITQLGVGTSGQLVFGVTGADPQFSTLSQDCTVTNAGVLTCLKTNNVAFGALATVTPGTGIATALAVNVGTAGAPVINGGALGTPSSGTGTNLTGIPTTGLTGTLQAAQEPAHTGDVTNAAGSLALAYTNVVPSNKGGAGSISGALKANGSGTVTQAACADLSNGTASCSTDTTSAANISSGTLNPARQIGEAGSLMNCTLAASVASNNLTIALKTQAGADPSAGSPCVVSFRNVTATTGDYTAVLATTATSVVFNSGSGFGAPGSSTPFRIWITAWNNAGTIVLGASNQTGANDIFPIFEGAVQSSTACSACATATAAGTFYTTAAQTSKAIRILGYMEWATGLATTGVWASGPTTIQLMGPGIAKPGEAVRRYYTTAGSGTTSIVTTFAATALAKNFTMASAANAVHLFAGGNMGNNTGSNSGIQIRFYRGSAACTTGVGPTSYNLIPSSGVTESRLDYFDMPFASATTSAQYTLCLASPNAPNSVVLPFASGSATLTIEEIMG